MATLNAGTTGFRINPRPPRDDRTVSMSARIPLEPWHAIFPGAVAALCGAEVIDVGQRWLSMLGPVCLECLAEAQQYQR